MSARTLMIVVAFVAIGIFIRKRQAAGPPAGGAAVRAETASQPAVTPATEVVVSPTPAVEARDDAAISRQVEEGAGWTYIKDILAQQDQMIIRWPERRLDALRVWVEPVADVKNWDPRYPLMASRVFDEWERAGFPVRFEFQKDSAGAAIQIRWTTSLVAGGRQIGITRKRRDQHGWIDRAEIEIATHDGLGNALTPETVGGVARHEVGHALGLGHSGNTSDVMYPESTTPVISARDRATLHLLYTLPPGVVK